MSDEKSSELSLARSVRLRNSGLKVEALNDNLKSRLALLDEDELRVVEQIKEKLNRNLADAVKEAADTVGGFVW